MNEVKSKRVKWLHLRLSPTEHELILKKREKSTCRTLSQYIRNIILDRPVVTTYRNVSQDDIIQQLVVLNNQLNALGNNLNQITKRLHTLRPLEEQSWGLQYSQQAETLLVQISEVKGLTRKIAEQWLR